MQQVQMIYMHAKMHKENFYAIYGKGRLGDVCPQWQGVWVWVNPKWRKGSCTFVENTLPEADVLETELCTY